MNSGSAINSTRRSNEDTSVKRRRLLLGFLTFLVISVHTVEELFDRDVVNGQEFTETLYGDVSLSLFDAPILDTRQVEVVGKIFMAGVAFLLAQDSKFCSDARQGIT